MRLGNFFQQYKFASLLFLLFLASSFLMPLYHQHVGSYEQRPIIPDEHHAFIEHSSWDIHGVISENHAHSIPHLHLKRDFVRSHASYEPVKKIQQVSFITPHTLAFNSGKGEGSISDLKRSKPGCNFARIFSGLSPPAC